VRRQSHADYTAHDEVGLGGSDPLFWADLTPKCVAVGRSRPNRGFRLRSFFSVEFPNSFLGVAFPRTVGERNALVLG